ncbi:MAG TPA: ATP:cob(I)alamin adenosyltransferase [Chloroflexi bacterium]|jgi:cob(I)alamin adenosyltransferase|nr:ATP:cob(I)alamin adenosyltransferase [Chloroflexota bacterium]
MEKKKAKNPIGFTDLLGISGVPKTDLRVNLLGSLDEASAALGMARAFLDEETDKTVLENCQRELSSLMAFVASIGTPRQEQIEANFFQAELESLESKLETLKTQVEMPRAFIFPGENQATGSLNFARAIVRRTERELNAGLDQLGLKSPTMLQYLNRLSSLCFLLILKYSKND